MPGYVADAYTCGARSGCIGLARWASASAECLPNTTASLRILAKTVALHQFREYRPVGG